MLTLNLEPTETTTTVPAFLLGGGEMGRLTRMYPWSQTPLGPPESWPQSLCTTIGILLHSKFPMFLFWGPDARCFYNDAYRPSLGNDGKHPGALGRPGAEVWPEIWKDIRPQIAAVLANGSATWHEDQLLPIYRNGQLEDVYWTYSYSPVFDESGRPAGVFVTCTETTQTVRMIGELQDANEKAKLAIEAGNLGVTEVDLVTGDVYVSPRIATLFHLDSGSDRGDFLQRMHPDDLPLRDEAYRRAAGDGRLEYESRVLQDDGSLRWIRLQGTLFFDEARKPRKMIAVLQDISEQKRFSEELGRQVQERTAELELAHGLLLSAHGSLQSIINVFTSALQVLEPVWKDGDVADFRYKLTNEAYAAYTGKSPEELTGLLVSDIFPGYFDSDSFRNIRDVALSGNARIWENHYRADGLDIYNEMGAVPMNGDIVVHLTDFTRLKQLQHELERNITELKRSNQHLEEFAHAASHDLKEPIRKIHFFTTLLKDQLGDQLSDAQAGSLQRIEKASRRMGLLVDDLLSYSHVADRPHEMERVDLTEVVRRVLEDLDLDIRQKEAAVELNDLPTVAGYRRQLQQLFQNLISNALKYSKKDLRPRVVLSAGAATEGGQRYTVIRVRDNGIGFDDSYQEKIFEMFARLHGKNEYSGSGVGLSIVKKVMENHNGFIRAHGSSGDGALFELFLPDSNESTGAGLNSHV